MTDLPEPTPLPPGMSRLKLSKDEVDYLQHYWELQDLGQIFAWAVKMLHDLSKLDEAGWRLTLTKAEINEETKQVTFGPDHRQIYFLLKWLAPTKESYLRLPKPEVLETIMKVTKP